MNRVSFFNVVLAIGCLAYSGKVAAAERDPSGLVVLGGFQAGKNGSLLPHDGLTRSVIRGLENLGEAHRQPKRALAPEDRDCRTLECLLQFAMDNDAERVLIADATVLTTQLSLVRVLLFDARNRQTVDDTIRCEQCDEAKLALMVSTRVAQFVERYPATHSLNTGVRPTAPDLANPENVDVVRCRGLLADCEKATTAAKNRNVRFMVAGGFGGLLLGGVTTSLAFAVMAASGTQVCTLPGDYSTRTCAPAGTLSLGVLGASAIPTLGLILTLALPSGK